MEEYEQIALELVRRFNSGEQPAVVARNASLAVLRAERPSTVAQLLLNIQEEVARLAGNDNLVVTGESSNGQLYYKAEVQS